MKSDRRTFLGSLGALGALAACNSAGSMPGVGLKGVSTASNLFNPLGGDDKLLLYIVNKTGVPAEKIFFATFGQEKPDIPDKGIFEPYFHLTDARTGTLAECKKSDGNGGTPNLADYSLNLATDTDNGKMKLPSFFGRMFISFDKPLNIVIEPFHGHTQPQSPVGFDRNSPQKNFETLFDFWEFTNFPARPETGFNGNLTSVQGLGFPLLLEGFGPAGKQTTGFKAAATRTAIFSELLAEAVAPFNECVIPGGKYTYLRAVSPDIAIEFNGKKFPDNYLKAYIDAVWAYYTTQKLTMEIGDGQFKGAWVGQVDAEDHLFFSNGKAPGFYYKRPSTLDVFKGSTFTPVIPDPNPETSYAASLSISGMAGAFNRTIWLVNKSKNLLPVEEGSKVCKDSVRIAYNGWVPPGSPSSTVPITNYYAKYLHAASIGGRCYAFANDDNCAQSSFMAVRSPTKGVVTILPFG